MDVRTRRLSVAYVASHTYLPPSVSVVVAELAELAEFRVKTAARADNWVSTVAKGVCAFVAI